jgi:Xaa-Pro aminopeptidase
VVVSTLEAGRVRDLGTDLEVLTLEDVGIDELLKRGLDQYEVDLELYLQACRQLGVHGAVAPLAFPLGVADHLRANGIEIVSDTERFDARRRAKNEAELAGIRRAARASEQAFARAREVLATRSDVTCEDLRVEVARVFTDAGVVTPDPPIISHGAQTAVGHEPGHGLILAHEPIVLDLYPQDPESGCYSDMTRTFCVGTPPAELAGYVDLCRQALERVLPAIRPGVTGAELHRIASEVFSDAGHPTQLTKKPGEPLAEGFFHSLGHGVGLEVHEEPGLGRNGGELVAGDVVAVEPGCYRPGFGGARLEDLVLVTEDGHELLTHFPYDLEV